MSTTAWNHIVTRADANNLLGIFGAFHDSCLREAHVWTEHWVGPDLHMSCASNLDTRARLLIQRQFAAPSAIELLFEQMVAFHLQPSPQNYDSIIFDATVLLEDDTRYWADCGGWLPTDSNRDHMTWIGAKTMSWRDASDWMGATLRYGSRDCTVEA